MNRPNKEAPQILIVDDDTTIRNVITDLLLSKGYRVVGASNGLEASLKIKNQKFNLVITDLNMPKKDGIKLTNEIIASNGPPVLLMTGELETYDIKLRTLENTVLLPKPFNPKIILALVSKMLSEQK